MDFKGHACLVPLNFVSEYYKVKEAHGFIWAFYGDAKNANDKINFFEDVDDRFTYDTITDHWNVQYSRVIENQLDVVHIPFIHKTTIGRGNKTLVNGHVTTIDSDNTITIKVFNTLDLGESPKKAEELINIQKSRSLFLSILIYGKTI